MGITSREFSTQDRKPCSPLVFRTDCLINQQGHRQWKKIGICQIFGIHIHAPSGRRRLLMDEAQQSCDDSAKSTLSAIPSFGQFDMHIQNGAEPTREQLGDELVYECIW